MNVHHLTIQAAKEKYLKFKHRLNKSIASGSFDKLPRKKKNKLVSRIEKLRNRLEGLSSIKKGAVAAGSVVILPNIGMAQDPALRFEKSDFDLSQFGTNQQVEIVDIDSDNDLDVIFSTSSRGYVQKSNNGFFNADFIGALSNMEESFNIGDVDGDSDIDIVFKNGNYFYLALNDGDGNFELTEQSYYYSSASTPGAIGRETSARDVDLVDFDSDGDLDLVIAYYSNNLKHFKNDGTGTFSDVGYLSVGKYSGITDFEFIDLDGDMDLDLVHNQSNANPNSKVYAKENTFNASGDPDFSGANTQLMYSSYAEPLNITAFDMDGDGDLDIFIPDNGGISGYSHRVLENEYSEGSPFSFPYISLSGFTSESINDVAVADLNGDGNDDLLIAFASDSKVGILDGGSFTASSNSLNGEIGDASRIFGSVALGDLDGDGLDDIVGLTTTVDPYIYFDRSGPYISNFVGDVIIDENTPAGLIGTFSFSDFHSDPITASLSGDDAGLFTLNSSTGEFSANQSFDWETFGSEADVSIDFSDGIKSRNEKVNVKVRNIHEEGQGYLSSNSVPLGAEYFSIDHMTAADVDMDGDDDLFFEEKYFLENKELSFEDHYINDFSSGATEVVFMDADDDGDLDLFGKDNSTLYALENVPEERSSDGWYTMATYSIGSESFGLIPGDFDDDGLEEIALVTSSSSYFYFSRLEMDADNSSFTEVEQIDLVNSMGGGYMESAGRLVDIAIADFDGDGNDDLLIIAENDGSNPGTDVLFTGDGDGFSTTNTPITDFNADNGFNRIEIGDLNEDGVTDIVALRYDGSEVNADIMINDGSGGFTVTQSLNLGGVIDSNGIEELADLKLGDMDGDGSLDILVTSTNSGDQEKLDMWLNDGSGTFTLKQTLTDIDGTVIELMDVDKDDDLDIVLSQEFSGSDRLVVFFNANVSATNISLSATSFDEHLDEDTQVGTITVADSNPNDTHIITLAEGDGTNDEHNNFFAVNGNNLILTRDVSAEDFPTLNILLAADDGTNTFEQSITLTVNQVNIAPTAITAPTDFDEGTPAGTSIGTLSATDDGVEAITFALATGDGSNDADNGSFVINGDQLVITEESRFETKSTYDIYISASDIDGSVEQAFTINVNDINQAPTAIGLSPDNFDEDTSGGTSVSTLSATDANAGDTFTYSLTTGDGSNDADNSKFAIEGDQLILLQNISNEDQSSVSLYLEVSDSSGETFEQAVTLTVNNVNSAPTGIQLSATSFDEDTSAGNSVATLSAEDADGADSHTFSLVTGDGSNDADNSKFTVQGNQLILIQSVAFQDQSSVNIYLQVTDSFGESFEQAVTLAVNEISVELNNPPTGINLSTTSFDEDTSVGTTVASLSAEDADATDTHTFELVAGDGSNDADNSKFAISSNQLILLQSVNQEDQASVSIYIQVTDSSGDTFDQAVSLTVNNVNSAPTGITLSSTSFDEDTSAGSAVATLSADDEDVSDTHEFDLVTGDGTNDADNGKFTIQGNQLILLQSIAQEDQSSVSLYIEVTDSFGESIEQEVTLTVNNVNSVPTAIELSATVINEHIAAGSTIATISAVDVDVDDTHSFKLIVGDGVNDADNSKFLIDGNELIIKQSPSFEAQASYNIYLSASDSEGSVAQGFEIAVNDVNQAPTSISLSVTALDENILPGSTAATFTATDANLEDEHIFTLVAGDGTNDTDNSKFVIQGNELILISELEFNDQTSVSINVKATDSFEESITQDFSLTLNEVLGLGQQVNNKLGIYPNPGLHNFQINLENELLGEVHLRISDLSGRVIKEFAMTKTSKKLVHTIDMSEADTGVYVIELSQGDQIIMQRWIKGN